MPEERNPQQDQDEEGRRLLNETDDEVEGHFHHRAETDEEEGEDEVQAHFHKGFQSEDPGRHT